MTQANARAQMPLAVRRILPPLALVGMAGLMVTFWLGFEEPNPWLLLLSAALVIAAPLAAVLHLAGTRRLTTEDRQTWWVELTSAEVWSALSEYLSSSDLGSSARRRAIERAMRRELSKTRKA